MKLKTKLFETRKFSFSVMCMWHTKTKKVTLTPTITEDSCEEKEIFLRNKPHTMFLLFKMPGISKQLHNQIKLVKRKKAQLETSYVMLDLLKLILNNDAVLYFRLYVN